VAHLAHLLVLMWGVAAQQCCCTSAAEPAAD